MEKNEIFETGIVDMTEDGEGIGKVDGFTVFIKDTVIGDHVEAKLIKSKKTYGYGRLVKVLSPSAFRVEPTCPVAAPCGGCQLQAMSYESQLKFKESRVRGHLERIGHFTDIPMEPIIGMEGEPLRYRNKAQFPVGKSKDGQIITGFYAGRTHSIIPVEDCLLGMPVNRQVTKIVTEFMEKYHIEPYNEETHRGLVRHILVRCGFHTGQVMVCLVINGTKLPRHEELVKCLSEAVSGLVSVSLNVNREKTNAILGRELINLYGHGYLEDMIGDVRFRISPLSFFQVNPVQTEKLYGKALEFAGLSGGEIVWDLYCGIGTISLFLAKKAKQVYGVEIIPAAIENAKENARLNHMDNAEFFVGKAEEVLPEKYAQSGGTMAADVIVVDPPRKGCDEALLDTMVKMAPKRIVYVSCNSATLARDLRFLCDRGYELMRVQACDMFPMSVHTETVVLLCREKADDHIRFSINTEDLKKNVGGYATYGDIKAYVLEKFGLKVSSLYIAQTKDKCGIKERENYYIGEGKSKELICPPEKEQAIMDAFRHFGMLRD